MKTTATICTAKTMGSSLAHWAAGLFSATALLLGGGCETGAAAAASASNDDEYSVASAALEESQGGDQDGAISTLAFPEDPSSDASAPAVPPTAQERLDKLKGYIKKSLSCATVIDDAAGGATKIDDAAGGATKIAFGKSCLWKGRRWEGDVTISYTGANTATVTLSGVNVDGTAEISGSYTVTRNTNDMTVKGERTVDFADRTVTTTLDAKYEWDDESITVVSANRVRTVGELTATMTTTDLHWLRSEVAPDRGTVAWTTLSGKAVSVVFSRDESGALIATVTSARGTKVLSSQDVLSKKKVR